MRDLFEQLTLYAVTVYSEASTACLISSTGASLPALNHPPPPTWFGIQ